MKRMRVALVAVTLLVSACPPPVAQPQYYGPATNDPPQVNAPVSIDLSRAGVSIGRSYDFAFDGGRIEFELRRDDDRVIEIARNHYAVPLVIAWHLENLDNLSPLEPSAGVVTLPAAPTPNATGPAVVLTTLRIMDRGASYHREMQFHARFGDPDARPTPYSYRIPYRSGKRYSVLQGFHGAFSHHGSNEYAIDFDCPVATHVLATRPGIVVATNASAQGAGTTPDFLEYKRVNWVLVLHDDGTIGEYMHLAPAGVEVQPGTPVNRGDELALSGNTGFSSTPHLHFQVMTAGEDGISAQSFPFKIAVSASKDEEPVQGRAYTSWE
jgi:murein DD-endopeptidase MepM/ murein hydrolase activator NlpD